MCNAKRKYCKPTFFVAMNGSI